MNLRCIFFLFLLTSIAWAQVIKVDTLSVKVPIKNYTILDGLASNETYHTHIDSKGYLWISSDKGVSRFDGYEFVNFTTNDGLIDNTIFNIFEDIKGRIWFIGSNRKLCYFDWKKSEMITYKYNYVIDGLKEKYNAINFKEEKYSIIRKIENFSPNYSNNISNEDAIIKDLKKFKILSFRVDVNNTLILELNNRTIYIDKLGNISESTCTKPIIVPVDNNYYLIKSFGIDSIDFNNINIQKNFTLITSKSNGFYLLLNNEYTAIKNIHVDNLNTIGIYKINDTLFFDSENKYIHVKEFPNKEFVQDSREKNTQSVYSPTWDNISNQKFYSGSQFSYSKLKNYGIIASSISVENETMYFVHENFLEIYKDNKITSITHDKRMYSSCIFNNKLILGTENGLATLSQNNTINEYVLKNLNLKDVRIQDLLIYNNSLIVATRVNGIYIVGNNFIKHLTEKDGLAGDFINHIRLDNNVLWVASNQGLSAFKIEGISTEIIYNIDKSHGILSPDVRQIYLASNTIYLGLANGISILDLEKFKKQNELLPFYLESIIVNDSVIFQKKSNEIQLKYYQNNIRFQFSGISPTYSNKIKYRYKLEAVNNNWIETFNRSISYNVLPPGEYIFKVQIQNDKKEWQKNTIEVKFTIATPFWKTLWFKIFLFSLGSFLIVYLILYFVRKNEQEEKLNLLLNKSEHKALLTQMNPHFIFNSLNSTQNFLLKNDTINANRYIVKLSNLIRNTFENSKRTFIPLSEELQSIKLYVDLENMRFENKINMLIHVEDDINVEQVLIPTLLIQPFVENAIHHGILMKSDRSSGEIIIKIFRTEAFIKVLIEDNGIGRKASKLLQVGSSLKNRESSGIEITKNRIMLINKIEKMKFEFHIVDLFNSDNKPSGTRVEFTIPLKLI